ncbi:MAG: tRNA(Ile)-lysidine synthetase, partial [Saprospiraceae bacterium]|nr:tRNA(Ile)-lysidine synthetase [Pyrinomonadaceae bacterium]
MHKFVRNLITEWRRLELPFSGQTFIVAVSGGADSVSLLLALHDLKGRKKLDLRFIAAHFNHNLRAAESDADEAFVKQLTVKLGLELA